MYDTIIIGAGMSGLAAGVRLAHFDQRVCILERHRTIGGLNSFYRLQGRDFDVGLHALTNYAPPGRGNGPLRRVLRQLRIDWDELQLAPQLGSAIVFPGAELRFSNDFELLAAEVRRLFPGQDDALRRLAAAVIDYDDVSHPLLRRSARTVLGEFFTEPQLVEMLMCPVLFYGSAQERDCDFGGFSILFRSIFLEGFARPPRGVRQLIKPLVRRFKASGGELRLRAGVSRLTVENDSVTKVALDDGTELAARRVLSSAGWNETLRMCAGGPPAAPAAAPRISYVESISTLDVLPKALGWERSIVFFSHQSRFQYRQPEELVDVGSGVICSPNNFAYAADAPQEGVMRVSALANHQGWASLGADEYRQAKAYWQERMLASAVRITPDFRAVATASDMFTPKTIQRFTGHDCGAVYGAAEKRFDGRTHLQNLFVCGNDQGMVGVIGTLLSGITMANKHCLKG